MVNMDATYSHCMFMADPSVSDHPCLSRRARAALRWFRIDAAPAGPASRHGARLATAAALLMAGCAGVPPTLEGPSTAGERTTESSATTAAEEAGDALAWPSTLVVFEQLRLLDAVPLNVPGSRARGRITGPVILHVLVDAQGVVRRVRLYRSCGNPDMDRESMHFARGMRYAPPVLEQGTAPQAVTLLLPVHLPKSMGSQRESWQD